MKIVSHRGFNPSSIENTLTSFAHQASLGIKSIEFDVQFTADHQPVVFHDYSLWRMAKKPIPISWLTWKKIKSLTISKDKKKDRISHLSEVLDFFQHHKLEPIVDVKPIFPSSRSMKELFSVLKQYPNMNILVNSFSDIPLSAAIKHGLRTFKNLMAVNLRQRALHPLMLPKILHRNIGFEGIIVDKALDPKLWEFSERLNLKVLVGARQEVNSQTLKFFLNHGAQGIMTNDTPALKKLLKRLQS